MTGYNIVLTAIYVAAMVANSLPGFPPMNELIRPPFPMTKKPEKSRDINACGQINTAEKARILPFSGRLFGPVTIHSQPLFLGPVGN